MSTKKDLLDDDRFSKILRDPKFKKLPKHERKVKIDKRFQSMFTNNAFKVKYSVDKRGRRISKSTTEDFKKFYDLSSDDESEIESCPSDDNHEEEQENGRADNLPATSESDTDEKQKVKNKNKKDGKKEKSNEFPSLTQEEGELGKKQISAKIRKKLKDMNVDYARGEGKLFSESSSDESESEESDEEIVHEWNELDRDAETTDNITNRLAICNMDWDRVKAIDLMKLFNSFLPARGVINSVIIYPSEFGLKRLAEEELKGPAELINEAKESSSESDSENEDNEEGKRYHMERMREYQLKRLKYFYAVATFDSSETADFIYNSCNGVEYESSGIRLDLRFIDDDITFDQEPKDVCDSTHNLQKYKPLLFTNTALQQAKVQLTWDETDPRRLEITQKIAEAAKTRDIDDSDLENLVALSSSGEEEVDEEENSEDTMSDDESTNDDLGKQAKEKNPILAFRKLLKEIEENERGSKENESEPELEITWGAGDRNLSSTKTNDSSKQITRTSEKQDEEFTPFQRLLEKKKEKARMRKAMRLERQKQSEDQVDDDSDNINSKSSSKKKSKNKTSENEIDEKQKNELELLLLEENQDDKHHFCLKKLEENEKKNKKRKFKKDKNKPVQEDDFQVDVNDDRFSALYSSHLFNIDPTDSKFHKTKGMRAFVEEKQRRLIERGNNITQDEPPSKKSKDAELSLLVKSVKRKAKSMLPLECNKRK